MTGFEPSAAHVLGDIFLDAAARPQDRIAAARVGLAAAGPLFRRGLVPVTEAHD